MADKNKDSLANYPFEDTSIEVPTNLSIKGKVFIHPTVKLPPMGA